MNEFNSLRNGYKLCKSELTSMKHDQSSKRLTRSTSKKIADENRVDNPRTALFAAIQSQGSKKNAPSSNDPRQALFAAIKNKNNAETAETDEDSPASDVQYSPGVNRLQKFLNYSKSILSLAEKDQDVAVRACKVRKMTVKSLQSPSIILINVTFASQLQGLAVYCGEEGGERSTPALLQVLSSFAQSLECGVKKYDARAEAEKRKAAKIEKEKGKENMQNTIQPSATIRPPTTMLKASSFQPHVGATDKVKVLNAKTPGQTKDPKKAVLHTIDDGGLHESDCLPPSENMSGNPRQALLASIKNRRDSLPSQRPPDSVPNRIRHIDTNIARKESRVLLVNRMLSEAPTSVKQGEVDGLCSYPLVVLINMCPPILSIFFHSPQDFLKGFSYKQTSDPLLKKVRMVE